MLYISSSSDWIISALLCFRFVSLRFALLINTSTSISTTTFNSKESKLLEFSHSTSSKKEKSCKVWGIYVVQHSRKNFFAFLLLPSDNNKMARKKTPRKRTLKKTPRRKSPKRKYTKPKEVMRATTSVTSCEMRNGRVECSETRRQTVCTQTKKGVVKCKDKDLF